MMGLGALAASQPAWLKAAIVIAGTFILEDVATVLSAIAVQAHQISLPLALGSLYAGVAIGDMGLYGLGYAGWHWPALRRFLTLPGQDRTREWFLSHTIRIVAISRFVPGARLPLYTACGYFRVPFWKFALTAICATLVWTSLLFALSLKVGHWLLLHQAGWRWAGIIGFVLCIFVIGRLIAHFQRMSA
ncbi:hypothetical protein E3E11_00485 [Oecophyllibacter saccharovorans]|uniref:VTT domain-containing protein n=1 Tax=Oecophyllibacter saccharovorans TaxID=2558360 RepID=A0A506US45_9PROT|nr:VTT domain-containing protein [Oecophyllibacter saccharovorans]QDH15892.1 hypothetical protein E3E11_00485 [Oecophyllibacter saccharovorans]TPW36164.1 hypothetical protein E3202_01900 [Oecophyllibacter saccharovorans]